MKEELKDKAKESIRDKAIKALKKSIKNVVKSNLEAFDNSVDSNDFNDRILIYN